MKITTLALVLAMTQLAVTQIVPTTGANAPTTQSTTTQTTAAANLPTTTQATTTQGGNAAPGTTTTAAAAAGTTTTTAIQRPQATNGAQAPPPGTANNGIGDTFTFTPAGRPTAAGNVPGTSGSSNTGTFTDTGSTVGMSSSTQVAIGLGAFFGAVFLILCAGFVYKRFVRRSGSSDDYDGWKVWDSAPVIPGVRRKSTLSKRFGAPSQAPDLEPGRQFAYPPPPPKSNSFGNPGQPQSTQVHFQENAGPR
ncbi:uncharacterized protein BJ171DRAFT_485075 [Polychytrium aggregatum]|uniref:uncharacterized protein n=1 Tax=Polychytrium aggregatum TaxID=110093 RepID=UPI0022FE9A45|nr:uncharacterized protein BJ171DRAFT_485075 [Polychytrium aggregatum]KAI9209806.1 hypothetical protein BJ171DRAFT_485075 [Polychytrium aggregatum]